jgi:protein TilB
MRHITLELIRKRSEHNESLVSNLEEIALHKEELEAVGPILGRASGKTLKILLLQNNIIQRLLPADFRHFKSLEYLNVALNNIEVVEGIGHLEFLNKLDFTLNFIHLDRLEESVACLSKLRSLKELFMIGNPCMNVVDDADADTVASNGKEQSKTRKKNQGWANTRMYLVAKLPQLEYLDGTKITRSERIRANRSISNLEEELSVLALKCREEKQQRKSDENSSKNLSDGGAIGDSEVTEHCPEDRTRLGHEMAQQKAEKEKNEKANQPKFKTEKDYNNEQVESVQSAREREKTGNFKQCNGT